MTGHYRFNRKITLTDKQLLDAIKQYTKEPINEDASMEFIRSPDSTPEYVRGSCDIYFFDPAEDERCRLIEENGSSDGLPARREPTDWVVGKFGLTERI